MTAVVGEIVRRMEALGLTPKRLSLSAGLNETYVRDLVAGRVDSPRPRNLKKLAQVLKCSVIDLLLPAQHLEGNEALMLKRAVILADRVIGDASLPDREGSQARIAKVIYDVLVERGTESQPISENDEEAIALIEALMRRMLREM